MKHDLELDDEPQQDGFLSHLPIILMHRRWLVIVPLVICALAGTAAALLLPASYTSQATLLVESQALPAELVGAPLTTVIDQRIARIRQQILSRPDLTEIILANNLYPEERSAQPLSAIIDHMRSSVGIRAVNADIAGAAGPNGGSNTVAFALSFSYPQAAQAQAVTQEFVERLLRLDQTQTAEQAENTVDFLREQAKAMQGQIEQVEGQIESIKAQNGIALAGGGGNIIMGGSYDAQIASIQRENALLAVQLSERPASPMVENAEAALAAAKAIYSDNHPDVITAQQRLNEARATARAAPPAPNSAVRAQIAANNAALARINEARAADTSRAAAALSQSASAPLLQEQIGQLQARADGLRTNYQRISTNLLAAETSVKLENEQKGERLSMIDPPVVPDAPTSPNRPVLIAGGIAAGAAIGLVLALGMELFLQPIRGVGAVTGLLGKAPLVVIPTMKVAKAGRRKRAGLFRRRRAKLAGEAA